MAEEFGVMENIMDFDYFVDMFKEFNGNETELRNLKHNFDMNWNGTCDEIIDAITNLPGGAERYFTDVLIYHDMMVCSERHVAETFKKMMMGYIMKQTSTREIFRYNINTQLWENAKFSLKTVFIHSMDSYFDFLDKNTPNICHFSKSPNTKAEDTKDYYKREKMIENFSTSIPQLKAL